jgi:two-component system, NarL family, nitrate/nitrite response regulator NarL
MSFSPATHYAAPVRLVFVADVRLYSFGLSAVLPSERITIVATAESREAAPAVVQAHKPDAVLIDVTLPDALELMRQLRIDPPAVEVIAFGVGDSIPMIVACAEAGASAYVAANATVDDLVSTVEGAVAGELRCPPRVAGELFRRAGERSNSASGSDAGAQPQLVLTARQRQILALLRQSLSNKEISHALNIAEATVKNHVHQLLDKLQVPNRAKAARWLPAPNCVFVRSRSTPASVPDPEQRHLNRR